VEREWGGGCGHPGVGGFAVGLSRGGGVRLFFKHRKRAKKKEGSKGKGHKPQGRRKGGIRGGGPKPKNGPAEGARPKRQRNKKTRLN